MCRNYSFCCFCQFEMRNKTKYSENARERINIRAYYVKLGKMSKGPPVSITDKVRECIADGRIREGIDNLLVGFNELNLDKPLFYNYRNVLLQLRSRFVRLEREKKSR